MVNGGISSEEDHMSAPLDGITVLDLTRNLAGPYATMVLGDLGARVIKVERPGAGDDTRAWSPPTWGGHSALFLALNRNKESVTLDVDDPDDAARVRALAARADVVVESNRAGSLERRGLGFEQVRELNPRIVYCSISGFGSVGPDRDRPGYDAVVQAASGVMSINGESGRMPSRVGPSIVDQGTGMWAALGVLAALRRRDIDGEGQHVETSLFETGVSWVGYQTSNYLASGTVPGPQGSRHSQSAPYEGFPTRDGHLFLATLNDALFRRLCTAIGREDLADDDRYRTNPDRVARRDELAEQIAAVLAGDDTAAWEARLREHGVPCSAVRTLDEVAADPQTAALGLLREYDHPAVEDLRLVDHPLTYNGTRSFRHDRPPGLGEHTDVVLGEIESGVNDR